MKIWMISRFFLLVPFLFVSMDQPKLVKTKIAAGITASIPKGWIPMNQLDFTERYPSVRAPLAAYTNEERSADFSVNISATQWPDADLELAEKFFRSSIMNMFDRVQFVAEGIREVHGKKYVYFEFESRVHGNNKHEGNEEPVLGYTHQQYLIEPKRTLVFTFNCPRRGRNQWEGTGLAVMKSLRIN
jgi:hypothetical protein